MKLIFTITSGIEYSITRSDSIILVKSAETEFILTECINCLKLISYPITSIEVLHYYYNSNFSHIMEFRQKLENMFIKKQDTSVLNNLPVAVNNSSVSENQPLVDNQPLLVDNQQAGAMLLQMLKSNQSAKPNKTFAPTFMDEKDTQVDMIQMEQDLLYLKKHISENKNIPDLKSNKSKDVKKSINYITSALGRRDISFDYVRELQKILASSTD